MTTKRIVQIAVVAGLYTAVSLVLAPFSFGSIQIRVAEALTLLPLIWKPGIFAVTLGCALTNLIGALMGVNMLGFLDIFIGTLATFLAALGTYYFRKKTIKGIPVISVLMPVVMNALFVGAELAGVLFPQSFWTGFVLNGFYVGIGELVSVILGWFLVQGLKKTKLFDDPNNP